MKKSIRFIAVAVMLIITVFVFMGAIFTCGPTPVRYERLVCGDFNLIEYSAFVNIAGLSEVGKAKKIIIVPERVHGKPVSSFTDKALNDMSSISSENLERLYVVTGGFKTKIKSCPNLRKVIFIDNGITYLFPIEEGISTYCSAKRAVNAHTPYYDLFTGFANISYSWNYEQSPNKGDYWLDDIDYGTKISFIPPTPTRDWYIFDGWYRESECINKWDFETDTIPQETRDTDGNTVYQETILYAKWIQENCEQGEIL